MVRRRTSSGALPSTNSASGSRFCRSFNTDLIFDPDQHHRLAGSSSTMKIVRARDEQLKCIEDNVDAFKKALLAKASKIPPNWGSIQSHKYAAIVLMSSPLSLTA